jgi:hypothetical protein
VGAYEVGAGAKKRRKNLWSIIQSGVRKMIAWMRGERKIILKLMKLNIGTNLNLKREK